MSADEAPSNGAHLLPDSEKIPNGRPELEALIEGSNGRPFSVEPLHERVENLTSPEGLSVLFQEKNVSKKQCYVGHREREILQKRQDKLSGFRPLASLDESIVFVRTWGLFLKRVVCLLVLSRPLLE